MELSGRPEDWTVPLIRDFLRRLGWKRPDNLDLEPMSAAVIEEIKSWNIGEDEKKLIVAVPVAVTIAAYAYAQHDWETQVYIATMTVLFVWIDDAADTELRALSEFHRRLYSREPQLHPALDRYIEVMKRAYKYFEPISADACVVSCTTFLTGSCIEEKTINSEKPMALNPSAHDWPYFIRDKTGITSFYAFALYEQSKFPDLTTYIQAIPDMLKFINFANDIASSYKEEARGEQATLIRQTAAVQNQSVRTVTKNMIEEALHRNDRIRNTLRGNSEAESIWETFLEGFMMFHAALPRYNLPPAAFGL